MEVHEKYIILIMYLRFIVVHVDSGLDIIDRLDDNIFTLELDANQMMGNFFIGKALANHSC